VGKKEGGGKDDGATVNGLLIFQVIGSKLSYCREAAYKLLTEN